MYLAHPDYEVPEKPEKVVPDVKKGIKDFVDKGKKSYEQIIKEIQKTHSITNGEIRRQIKEVQTEWYPVEEEEIIV